MNNYLDKDKVQTWLTQKGLGHTHLEKPAMYRMLPDDLSGKVVLCAGCADGSECDELVRRGAAIIGFDVSPVFIELAAERHPSERFFIGSLESVLHVSNGEVDYVFCSLAIHYREDWTEVLREFARVLKPGGEVVFSTHNPITWGAEKFENAESKVQLLGYTQDKLTGTMEFHGDYLGARLISGELMHGFEVSYYHKPFSQIVREIIRSGLTIVDCDEPAPIAEAAEFEAFYARGTKYPLFILFRLVKPQETVST